MLVTKKQEQNSYYCYLRNEIIELRNFPFMVDHFRSWPQTSEILEDTILRYPTNLPEYTAVSIPPGSLRCGGPSFPPPVFSPLSEPTPPPSYRKLPQPLRSLMFLPSPPLSSLFSIPLGLQMVLCAFSLFFPCALERRDCVLCSQPIWPVTHS